MLHRMLEQNKEWILADLEQKRKERLYEDGFAYGHTALEKKYLTALRIRGFSDEVIESITGTVDQL